MLIRTRLSNISGLRIESFDLVFVTAPIVGASTIGQLEDAVGALDLTLAAEEIAALEAPYVPHAISGHE